MSDHDNGAAVVGRVLRASTRGYNCGTHSNRIGDQHNFGSLVMAPAAQGGDQSPVWVIGLVYAVEIKDDLMINELVMAEAVNRNVLRDQRENRMVPVEISVLNVGYYAEGAFVHSLPPRPPMSLTEVTLCTPDEVIAFTRQPDYFRLILQAAEVPSDDLLAACVRLAAGHYPPAERNAFLVMCGRHVARLLSGDARRLAHVLALLRPIHPMNGR